MAYINKGDMLLVHGRHAVADTNDYTKLVYDSYDLEMSSRWKEYEGGTAMGYVDVVFPDTGARGSYSLQNVKKVV